MSELSFKELVDKISQDLLKRKWSCSYQSLDNHHYTLTLFNSDLIDTITIDMNYLSIRFKKRGVPMFHVERLKNVGLSSYRPFFRKLLTEEFQLELLKCYKLYKSNYFYNLKVTKIRKSIGILRFTIIDKNGTVNFSYTPKLNRVLRS